MKCISPRLVGICLSLICLCSGVFSWAARPTESLLPKTTVGYVSVGNTDVLKANFDQCQIGQLMEDPAMKPFVDDIRKEVKARWLTNHKDLGLSLDDLAGIPGGEVSFAMVKPADDKYAIVILVDATKHAEQAKALMDKVTANLTTAGATKVAGKVKEIVAFDLGKSDKDAVRKRNRQAAFFYQDEWLCFADNIAVLEQVHARLLAPGKDTLDQVEAFTSIMQQCQQASAGLAPHARWFIDPFGYTQAVRSANVSPSKPDKRPDLLPIFKDQGFSCLRGIGGHVNFMAEIEQGKYDMLHRTMVYAPSVAGAAKGEKYKFAARMLKFPNAENLNPQPWVPNEVGTYTSFNFDIKNAFESCPTLVDAIAGQPGFFEDIIEGLKDDPNPKSPKIDIRRDLIGNLGTRVTILSDYTLPITTDSEHTLFAVEIANGVKGEKAVYRLVKKVMEGEKHKDIKAGKNGDIMIWEIVSDEESATTGVTIEIPGAETQPVSTAAVVAGKGDGQNGGDQLPNCSTCVYHGHLFVATHKEILLKVIQQIEAGAADSNKALAQAADVRVVTGEFTKLGADVGNCAKSISRTDEECRTNYELLRMGKMPESKTLLGKTLNWMLDDGKKGGVRNSRIDAHNLPEFDIARRYFGPGGFFVSNHEKGWMVTGFMLTKEHPTAEVAKVPKK